MRWRTLLLDAVSGGGCTVLLPFEDGEPDCAGSDERERNDQAKDARAICIDSRIDGRVDPPADEDWFVIRLQAGDEVTFATSGTCEQSRSPDTVLLIYDDELAPSIVRVPDQELCLLNDNLGCDDEADDAPEGNHCSRLAYTAAETRPHYIRLIDYSDASTGAYTLSVRLGL